MDSFPDLSLGSVALAIIAIFVIYMLIRGLARTIINVTCLGISGWFGFRVWQLSPSLTMDWLGTSSEKLSIGLPIGAFLMSFLILRKLVRFLLSATTTSSNEDGSHKNNLVVRILFAILPTLALPLITSSFIHHAGSIAELENFHKKMKNKKSSFSLEEQLKNSISSAIPQKLMAWLDPLASDQRLRLVKIITASTSKNQETLIDSKSGKTIPRAIIVDDPELMNLAKKGQFSELLRHPLLSEALKDPKVQKALSKNFMQNY